MKVTMETNLKEILSLPPFHHFEYMVDPMIDELLIDLLGDQYQEVTGGKKFAEFKMCEIPDLLPSWNLESICDGLGYLAEKALKGNIFYHIWDEETRKSDLSKERTGITAFLVPGKRKFAVVCPGGGYSSVCSIAEGFPVAKRLNELGYSAFVLQYRTGEAAGYPNPMDDLARSVQFILEHARELDVDTENYALAGFSAGGHLAASFGTETLGYKKYGIQKPAAIFLGYPVITMGEKANVGSRDRLLRESASEEERKQYSIEQQITENYPPVFLWQCEKDSSVPIENTIMLAKKLEEWKIPYLYETFAGEDHGWGIGTGTAAEGWLDRAADFWKTSY